MDYIDKWLKSLRLHKYTHLFKTLTYEEMLNLEEKFLIDLDITKGARNKMLVSIKKLNLRRERLANMLDDLDQQNISMKEALTALKDMLITPIPAPDTRPNGPNLLMSQTNLSASAAIDSNSSGGGSPASTPSLFSSDSSSASPPSLSDARSSLTSPVMSTTSTATITSTIGSSSPVSISNVYSDPYELTYLFIETFEKVAQRLIESAGMEDNACHGIMAAIVDDCLKHNSFTKEQKAKVASFRQHLVREQKARVANFKQHLVREQKARAACYKYQPQGRHYKKERQTYQEYSLLGPGKTFELPCLRALAAASEQHNRRQFGFFSV